MCACAERERVSSDVDLLSLSDRWEDAHHASIITINTTAIADRCAWILISAAALHRWLDGVDARAFGCSVLIITTIAAVIIAVCRVARMVQEENARTLLAPACW